MTDQGGLFEQTAAAAADPKTCAPKVRRSGSVEGLLSDRGIVFRARRTSDLEVLRRLWPRFLALLAEENATGSLSLADDVPELAGGEGRCPEGKCWREARCVAGSGFPESKEPKDVPVGNGLSALWAP